MEATDSPVKEASCICKLTLSIRRRSAGTISPSLKNTMSPGTTSFAGITLSSPSRSTRAVGADMPRSASSADCAFFSCTIPIKALTITIVKITAASIVSPSKNDNPAAATRINTIGSVICSLSIAVIAFGGLALSSL